MKTLFLTLRVFSATGGIEKVCRILGKALYEESINNEGSLQICSMYDQKRDALVNAYFPTEIFRGFGINKLAFMKETVKAGANSDVVILSHINLLLIGWLIKKISPATKIVLLAHGIEVWYPVSRRRKNMLLQCDQLLAVSSFTKSRIVEVHGFPREKCTVLNNCLDPLLPLPHLFTKSKKLLDKYGFNETDTILMTLTRLSSKERYKGYDMVIEAISGIISKYPGIKYLIAGNFDTVEKAFVDNLIREYGLTNNVVIPGYILNKELVEHFVMSDIYVMPSRKEGFGLVFIEAMYYGLPVIAGNEDGSTDALLHGALGQLVKPDDVKEIGQAIANIIEDPAAFTPDRELLMKHFGYEAYKQKLEAILHEHYQAA